MASDDITAKLERIAESLYERIDELAEPFLIEAMKPMLEQMVEDLDGFRHITGNTINSLAVALYHDGKLIGRVYNARDVGLERPMRMTLRKGETYDLDVTWGGSILKKKYVGKVGERNFWADEEAVDFLESHAPTSKGFAYLFVSSVDYAKYLEAKDTVNILTDWHDKLKSTGADVSEMR